MKLTLEQIYNILESLFAMTQLHEVKIKRLEKSMYNDKYLEKLALIKMTMASLESATIAIMLRELNNKNEDILAKSALDIIEMAVAEYKQIAEKGESVK